MAAVEEIVDADHEQVIDRVCAIDVGKSGGTVCVRLPSPDGGRRVSRVWQVDARVNAVAALAEQLVAVQVGKVTVESTSDYWRIWFYLLESAGLDVQLVNARDVKNVPGRPKTDKLDAVWLAKLTERGLLRPSFVPPAPWRVLRDYTRLRVDLVRIRAGHWNRLEKLLEDALIKVSSVASTMTTKSVRDMIEALIGGQRDPNRLAGLARGRMRVKHAALVQALTGRFDDHHGELARILLDQIDDLSGQIDILTGRIGEQLSTLTGPPEAGGCQPDQSTEAGNGDSDPCTAAGTPTPPATVVQRLITIPGIDEQSAQQILAEIGTDMSRFPTAGHLASWAKLTPRTIQSGNKNTAGRTGKGNGYLKGALSNAAAAAARTDTFLGERYRRVVKRRGKIKAIVAVARSILTIIWHLLADPTATFEDLGPDFYTNRFTTERKIRSHIRQLETLGYTVTLAPAA